MFGLGAPEIVVLLLIGLLLFGGPVVAVLVVLSLARKSGNVHRDDPLAELRQEVARLRAEVEELKRQAAQSNASQHVKGA